MTSTTSRPAGRITVEQFELLAQLTRGREPAKTAARRVLIDGVTQADAARELNMSPASVNHVVLRYRKADQAVRVVYCGT